MPTVSDGCICVVWSELNYRRTIRVSSLWYPMSAGGSSSGARRRRREPRVGAWCATVSWCLPRRAPHHHSNTFMSCIRVYCLTYQMHHSAVVHCLYVYMCMILHTLTHEQDGNRLYQNGTERERFGSIPIAAIREIMGRLSRSSLFRPVEEGKKWLFNTTAYHFDPPEGTPAYTGSPGVCTSHTRCTTSSAVRLCHIDPYDWVVYFMSDVCMYIHKPLPQAKCFINDGWSSSTATPAGPRRI